MTNIQLSSRTDEWHTDQTSLRRKLRQTWYDMLRRCYQPERKSYAYYGGRGIEVSLSWMHFEDFFLDMQGGYSKGLTLDRKDRNGNYCKENCEWLTRALNSSKSHRDYKRNRPKRGHNKTNKNTYIFIKDCETFTGLPFEFQEAYGLDTKNISAVVTGVRMHHKNWRVLCPISC